VPALSRLSAALLGFCAIVSAAHASILFSSDGSATPSFNTGTGYGSYASANSTAAMFQAASSGVLTDLVVANDSVGNGSFPEVLELRQDNAGVPGVVIDTFTVTLANSAGLVTAASSTHPSLVAGQTYWLEDTIPPMALVAWRLSNPAVPGTVLASRSNDGPWQSTCPDCDGTLPAFALIGATAEVPEPMTMELSLSALVALLITQRRRRASVSE